MTSPQDFPASDYSYLSRDGSMIDMVVALNQFSIDSKLKTHFLEQQRSRKAHVELIFISDSHGNPTFISTTDFLKTSNNTNPFNYKDGNIDPTSLTNLRSANFMCGFQYLLGLAKGYATNAWPASMFDFTFDVDQNFTNIQDVKPMFNAQFAYFNIFFIDQSQSPIVYKCVSQPEESAWVLGIQLDLMDSITSSQQSFVANNYPKAVQDQVDKLSLGGVPFSVRELTLKITDWADGKVTPHFPNIPNFIQHVLEVAFVPQLLSNIQALNALPKLSYVVSPEITSTSSSGFNISAVRYTSQPAVGSNQWFISLPNKAQKATMCLSYNCQVGSNSHDKLFDGPIKWNWFRWKTPPDYHGIIAIGSQCLCENWLIPQLLNVLNGRNIQLPQYKSLPSFPNSWPLQFEIDTKKPYLQAQYTTAISNNTTNISGIYSPILSLSTRPGLLRTEANLPTWNTIVETELQYTLTCAWSRGNQITITQNMLVSGRCNNFAMKIVEHVVTTTYTLSVDSTPGPTNGHLVFKTKNQVYDPCPDIVSNLYNFEEMTIDLWKLQELFKGIRESVKPIELVDPGSSSNLQNAFFPGGQTFSYADLEFTESGDLLVYITYLDR